MLRSNAPSVLNRKRNDEPPSESSVSNRTKKIRVDYREMDENEENEGLDDVVKDYN